MKYYVTHDRDGKLAIIGAEGFKPKGVLAEAPAGATNEDGDCIEQVEDLFVLNLEKKAAKETARAEAEAKAERDRAAKEKEKAERKERLKNIDAQINGAANLSALKPVLLETLKDLAEGLEQ